MISEILAKQDNSEVVRDKLAEILLLETGGTVRVFLERSNPWSEFVDAPESDSDEAKPIVNITYDGGNFDAHSSNQVERQKVTSTYNIDCYGYAPSEEDIITGGHIPGDSGAALAAQRAIRIVRNVLMSGKYTYLGLRGVVWRRWLQSIAVFQPQLDGQTIQHVVAGRLSFNVDHSEFSPQVAGEPLETISVMMKRAEGGEVYFSAEFGA